MKPIKEIRYHYEKFDALNNFLKTLPKNTLLNNTPEKILPYKNKKSFQDIKQLHTQIENQRYLSPDSCEQMYAHAEVCDKFHEALISYAQEKLSGEEFQLVFDTINHLNKNSSDYPIYTSTTACMLTELLVTALVEHYKLNKV